LVSSGANSSSEAGLQGSWVFHARQGLSKTKMGRLGVGGRSAVKNVEPRHESDRLTVSCVGGCLPKICGGRDHDSGWSMAEPKAVAGGPHWLLGWIPLAGDRAQQKEFGLMPEKLALRGGQGNQ